MKPAAKVVLFAVALITVCCAISFFMVRFFQHSGSAVEHELGHEWLHEQMELSDAEIQALESIEENYAIRQAELKAEFNARKAKLSLILSTSDAYSEEVTTAIQDIHKSHGALQQLSIHHYFDMMKVLSPENRRKLKNIAADALSQPK